jgi:hypothetical protein
MPRFRLIAMHGDVYRRLRGDPDDLVEAMAEAAGLAPDIDWDRVAGVIEARRGVATRVGTRSTSVVDRMFSR